MKSKTELGTLAAVVSDEVVTVVCAFATGNTQYTYLCDRKTAATLKDRDNVICSKGDGFVVPRVVAVHDACEIEDLNINYQWVVQKVDQEEADRLREWKENAADALYKRQRRAAQVALAAEVLGEGGDVLKLNHTPEE